jgi:hypothetical protein
MRRDAGRRASPTRSVELRAHLVHTCKKSFAAQQVEDTMKAKGRHSMLSHAHGSLIYSEEAGHKACRLSLSSLLLSATSLFSACPLLG